MRDGVRQREFAVLHRRSVQRIENLLVEDVDTDVDPGLFVLTPVFEDRRHPTVFSTDGAVVTGSVRLSDRDGGSNVCTLIAFDRPPNHLRVDDVVAVDDDELAGNLASSLFERV